MKVSFPPRSIPDVSLEGEFIEGGGRPCVISHPHPLAGGDMHHPIVEALFRAAVAAGLNVLRYNFRGVGASTGRLRSTSPLALEDLAGAIDFLGGGPVLAMAYSYGSRCTLHAIYDGEPIERASLVALPTRVPINRAAMSNLMLGRRVRSEEYVATPDLDLAGGAPKPVHVFAGDQDPLVETGELKARGVAVTVFAGFNHFFSRRLGNQPPDEGELDPLCAAALDFLGVG